MPSTTDGKTAIIAVQYDVPVTDLTGDEGLVTMEKAAAPIEDAGYQVAVDGQVPENVRSPGGTAELIGIGAAIVILLLAFGSFVAAVLPIGVALVGVRVGTMDIGRHRDLVRPAGDGVPVAGGPGEGRGRQPGPVVELPQPRAAERTPEPVG